MNTTIRKMVIEDYATVYSLWESAEGIGLSAADTKTNIARYLSKHSNSSFVALDGAKIIGAVLGGHDGRRGYIHHLAIETDYQNQGIGRRLVDACIEAFRKEGIGKCHVFIFKQNRPAISFWQKNGFHKRSDIVIMSYFTGQSD